eukprot:3502860-Alexandrium_andersonii.AAC.1
MGSTGNVTLTEGQASPAGPATCGPGAATVAGATAGAGAPVPADPRHDSDYAAALGEAKRVEDVMYCEVPD